MSDTIFALSTILGKSGVAVIRVSGQNALGTLKAFSIKNQPLPNQAFVAKLFSSSGDQIDQAIILYFKAPNSFTGEDVIELQTHGSIAVIKDILEELARIPGFRIAEPGEFSRRAFLNGKMDLTEAEGLVELIEAETKIQRQIAVGQMSGNLKNLYESWRAQIITSLAKLEAFIDFPDDDIPQSEIINARVHIINLAKEIEKHLSDNNLGEILLRGIRVAIIGYPNVGKSSILNTLAQRDVAIVSDIAGTTRDVLEVKLDLKGFPFVLYDTAGIRDTSDIIEQEGVRRAINTLENADICLSVLDANDPATFDILNTLEITDKPLIIALNKIDLNPAFDLSRIHLAVNPLPISAKLQSGLDKLVDNLLELARNRYSPSSDPLITKVRYRANLEQTLTALHNFLESNATLELMTEEVRLAASSLGRITGKIDVEEILDEVFSTFCIGK